MRGVLAALVMLGGCAGLRDLVPEGPVLGPLERTARFGVVHAAEVTYTGPARGDFPVPALQVWGVSYDLDLVFRTHEPDVDMHELARIATPDGPFWMAKDAARGTLRQTILTDRPDASTFLPEVSVPRIQARVDVDDRSTADWLDLTLHTTNLAGDDVVVTYQGKPPAGPLPKRNSATMGHSRGDLLAVLDLSHRSLTRRATYTIDGQRQRLVQILGIVPFSLALSQTQGGLSSADVRWHGDADGLQATHTLPGGVQVTEAWQALPGPEGVTLLQEGPTRRIRYQFAAHGDALELVSASVEPTVGGAPATVLRLEPALPDPRRTFDGVAVSAWVLDVGGQSSHATGTVRAWWQDAVFHVAVDPQAPRWVLDRHMAGTVSWDGQDAHVVVGMVGTTPAPGP